MALVNSRRSGSLINRYALSLWLRSPRGKRLLALEAQELKRVLPEVFGRHMIQIGSWGEGDELLRNAETLHRAVIGTVNDFGAQALASPEELPLMSKSVDGVVLPHTLEFAHSPHNVLREASRVLTDRGRLFVIGFNPWGGWAMRQRLSLGYRAFPTPCRYYGTSRLGDWLELLDFEVSEVRRFGIGFPWLAPQTQGRAWSLSSLLTPLSESYVLVAKKRVIPINLIGRTQRAQVKPLIGTAVAGAQSASTAANSVQTPPAPR